MPRLTPRADRGAASSPLESYLIEIDSTPLLTPAEERELGARILAGDAEARDRMIRANLRLVVKLAREHIGKGLSLGDLIAEGNLGLMRAVEGYDPDMNTRFSTYASYWIHQSMTRAIAVSAKTIRIPSYAVQLLAKWRREAARLERVLGHLPSDEEIAKSLGLSKRKLAIVRQALSVYVATGSEEEGEESLPPAHAIPDGRRISPEAQLMDSERMQRLAELLDRLDDRSAHVLRLRYGLTGDPKTLEEIGAILGLTRERVRQIERTALSWLANELADESTRVVA